MSEPPNAIRNEILKKNLEDLENGGLESKQ
jgi:hypothetical protein